METLAFLVWRWDHRVASNPWHASPRSSRVLSKPVSPVAMLTCLTSMRGASGGSVHHPAESRTPEGPKPLGCRVRSARRALSGSLSACGRWVPAMPMPVGPAALRRFPDQGPDRGRVRVLPGAPGSQGDSRGEQLGERLALCRCGRTLRGSPTFTVLTSNGLGTSQPHRDEARASCRELPRQPT